MQVVYTRLPAAVEHYTQELLHDGPACKISLMLPGLDSPAVRIGEVEVPAGGAILWFVFPGRPYEIASVFDAEGKLMGHYTNLIRPPTLAPGEWRLTDLYLDVWQPAGGEAKVLDEDQFEQALRDGRLDAGEAQRARGEAAAVLRNARARRWPPAIVVRHSLDAVSTLRFQRDEPGTYLANLIVGRLIAFGIYVLGTVSVVSLAFAGLTNALLPGPSPARTAWLVSIAASGAVLLVLALAGRLPATRRPRVEEALTERILFIGTLVAGVAVLLYPDSRLWRAALVGVYGALAVFLGIFAVARARCDRRFPALAATGLFVCVVALWLLLAGG